MYHEFDINSRDKNATHVAVLQKNGACDILDIVPANKRHFTNEYRLDGGGGGVLKPLYFESHDNPQRVYVCGPTGAGKSTYVGFLVEDYLNQHPKNRFILFSVKPKDPALDKFHPIRIKCDQTLIEDPIEVSELKKSIVVFDDIDQFADKKVVKALNQLRDNVMSTGRSENIACITTSQILLNGHKSQNTLINTNQVVVCGIHGGGKHHAFDFLTRYMKVPKADATKYVDLPSRFMCINRVMPQYILHEKGVILL